MWTCPKCGVNLLDRTLDCPICTQGGQTPLSPPLDKFHVEPRFVRPFGRLDRIIVVGILGTLAAVFAPLISLVSCGFVFGSEAVVIGAALIGIGHLMFVSPLLLVVNLALSFGDIFQNRASALRYDFILAATVSICWFLYLLLIFSGASN